MVRSITYITTSLSTSPLMARSIAHHLLLWNFKYIISNWLHNLCPSISAHWAANCEREINSKRGSFVEHQVLLRRWDLQFVLRVTSQKLGHENLALSQISDGKEIPIPQMTSVIQKWELRTLETLSRCSSRILWTTDSVPLLPNRFYHHIPIGMAKSRENFL